MIILTLRKKIRNLNYFNLKYKLNTNKKRREPKIIQRFLLFSYYLTFVCYKPTHNKLDTPLFQIRIDKEKIKIPNDPIKRRIRCVCIYY